MKVDLKNSIAKFRRPLNLLINLTVKFRAEKMWLIYKFSFSVNPSDIINDAQTRKSDSSLNPLITKDQFQAYSKKQLMGY